MKVTADTITEKQIRGLLTDKEYLEAREADRPPWRTQLHHIRRALDGSSKSREVCAEIWNSRRNNHEAQR